MRKYAWGIVNLLLGLVVFAALYIFLFQRQELVDWWRLSQYKPMPAVAEVADKVGFTEHGRKLFYASQPSIEGREMFNQHCRDTGEESMVLGCYRGQQIFIFDVTDPKLAGVKEVTAAHEMLHAAYDRLSSQDKAQADELVSKQIGSIEDARFKELVRLYNQNEPGELLNEMHSIIGTEYRGISPELEEYYGRYFTDRTKILDIADAYAGVFHASKDRIASYDQQLAGLKTNIEAKTAELDTRKAELDRLSAELDRLRGGDAEPYNRAANSFNDKVRSFNALVGETRGLITSFNELVTTRNAEAAAQNNLYHNLDSRYQPVQSQ